MTENFVIVVKMTQIIEEFKEELMQERKTKEQERKAKEEALTEAKKAKQRITELEKELARC